MAAMISTPEVIITEQPTSKPIKYRYECEGRSAGKIPGDYSKSEMKTYPSIKVVGYKGKASVIVSCVTKEMPYRPHPHSLVGPEGCNNGICIMDIPPTTLAVTFSNLGIQCVRRKDIGRALDKRQNETRIDPFNTGFGHRHDPASIDMNAVRLCFQVFIEDGNGQCTIPLQPVVSEPVYNKNAIGNLVICRLSECVSPVSGGNKDIYLLCKKVSKENIKVRFYEGDERNPMWEGFPDFLPTQVHEQTAIWFKAPPYKNQDITEPLQVFIQLLRPSDGGTSESRPFQFLPIDAEPGMLKRKRQKFGNDPRRHLLLELQNQVSTGATSYYNIPPTPEHFVNLGLNVTKPPSSIENDFTFPANPIIPSTIQDGVFDNLVLPQNEKIINLPSFNHVQNFREPENTSPGLYSPIYENINSPIYDDLSNSVPHSYFNYVNSHTLANNLNRPFNAIGDTYTESAYNSKQIKREKVKNALRAKCKSLQNTNATDTKITAMCTNPVELSNISMLSHHDQLQNDFGMCAGNENFSSLLDADFVQLQNLLVPEEQDRFNSLNIPMNAMTISDTSCNLSSLLNMDSSQLQSTISTEQLENLLAII